MDLIQRFIQPMASEGEAHELPNFITVLYNYLHGNPVIDFLHSWENVVFAFLTSIFLIILTNAASKNAKMVPGPLQNLVEMAVEGLYNFITGILGPDGKKFVPFLGTLFLYILCMNLSGLIPLAKSPTASINTTVGLAVCVFLYVQWTGIRANGPIGYIDHLMGQPRNLIGWLLVPLMLPLHIVEEFAKPLSLSLRLFGNITGEDILLFIFVGLGVAMLSFLPIPVGVPLQIPFIFLALLTSFIQALVFTLLSTIYFSLMLPHHEEEEHH